MLSPIKDSPCDLTGIPMHQKSPFTFLVEEIEDLTKKGNMLSTRHSKLTEHGRE